MSDTTRHNSRGEKANMSVEDLFRLEAAVAVVVGGGGGLGGAMARGLAEVGAVVYLASEASAMVTGHVLAVDGGTLAS
jgi:NAD(P)-dependent dehydrogenase (short-subunit alcohol dehydrogenase family)